MIAVDGSALMAILLGETRARACIEILQREPKLLISAVTLAEALIVANQRGIGAEMAALIGGLGFEVISATQATAKRVADAYGRWGRGVHPAGLNFGDCFAYEVARQHGCPLLFVGEDFTRTDIAIAA